jgi:ABC-type amino acid transport substrate-binding protein
MFLMTKRLFLFALMFLAVPLLADPLHLAGSMRLGDPLRQEDGQYRLPLIITTDADSVAPQAFSFRINFSTAVASAVVQHAGLTEGHTAMFEWQNASATTLSYVVIYDPTAISMPSGVSIVVADIVIAYPERVTPLGLAFDATSLTMISGEGGRVSATQGKETLAVAGMTINPTSWYASPAPIPAPTPEPAPAPAPTPTPTQRRHRAGGGH